MGTVLIVEDHCRSRDLLKNLVEQEGRTVVTAGDGREGLEHARHIPPPSVIVLDLSMPRMNGWEFLQQKTADPTIAGIPTIVLSGSSAALPRGAVSSLDKWMLKDYWRSSISFAERTRFTMGNMGEADKRQRAIILTLSSTRVSLNNSHDFVT